MKNLAILPGLTPIRSHQFIGLTMPDDATDKHVTNCSMLPWNDKLVLAYRSGWNGARIHIAEIAPDMSVIKNTCVNIDHPLAVGGQEDPRLFIHDSALYMAFSGVRVTRGDATIARQLFAVLGNDFQPVRTWEPQYLWTTQWEKNWQPFSLNGSLYAVYSMDPWRVVEISGQEANPVVWGERMAMEGVPWVFGSPRGGAAPVRNGDEFYCFFHGSDKSQYADGLPAMYTMGVMTFDAESLLPKRVTREPIMWPDLSEFPRGPHGAGTWYAATVYACGAFRNGDEWVISYGSNDHFCRVSAFKASDVEDRLCRI